MSDTPNVKYFWLWNVWDVVWQILNMHGVHPTPCLEMLQVPQSPHWAWRAWWEQLPTASTPRDGSPQAGTTAWGSPGWKCHGMERRAQSCANNNGKKMRQKGREMRPQGNGCAQKGISHQVWRTCTETTMPFVIKVPLKTSLFKKHEHVLNSSRELSSRAEMPCCVWPGWWVALVQDFCRGGPPSQSEDEILQTYPRAHGNFAHLSAWIFLKSKSSQWLISWLFNPVVKSHSHKIMHNYQD